MLSHHLAFCMILSPLSRIVCVQLWSRVSLWHMSTIRSPFSSLLIMSDYFSIQMDFCCFFTWVALSDVDLCFSLVLVTKADAIEEETK